MCLVVSLHRVFIFTTMQKKIFQLLDSIDHKFDIEIQDYFKLSLEDRNNLSQYLANSIFESCDDTGMELHSYIRGFYNSVQRSIEDEEYEKADLFQRILDLLIKKI